MRYLIHALLVLSVYALLGLSPNLAEGPNYSSVIRDYGSPDEKVEKETKRVEEWGYPSGKIIFKDGKILEPAEKRREIRPDTKPAEVRPPAMTKTESKKPRRTKQISGDMLDDILRSIPSEGSADRGQAPGGPGAQPPRSFMPMEPPP